MHETPPTLKSWNHSLIRFSFIGKNYLDFHRRLEDTRAWGLAMDVAAVPQEHGKLDKYLADIRGWVPQASVDLEGEFECMGY